MQSEAVSQGSSLEGLLRPLNEIERRNAPPRLFLQGNASLLRQGPRIAVVGTRHPSEAGQKRATRLVRYLVSQHVVVVSGLASGVDTIAHSMAIQEGGRTIGVLGGPVGVAWPRENSTLHAEIGRAHLLVSQCPPGTPIRRGNFPQRNRTMALIADASIIVEAGESSGSLSQGWEALRLGRPLFILKSTVECQDLNWPREMIRYGALVLSAPEELAGLLPGMRELDALPF